MKLQDGNYTGSIVDVGRTYLSMPANRTFDHIEAHYGGFNFTMDSYKQAALSKGSNTATYALVNDDLTVSIDWDDLVFSGTYVDDTQNGNVDAVLNGRPVQASYNLNAGFNMDLTSGDNLFNISYSEENRTLDIHGLLDDFDLALARDGDGYFSGRLSKDGVDYIKVLPTKTFEDFEFDLGDIGSLSDYFDLSFANGGGVTNLNASIFDLSLSGTIGETSANLSGGTDDLCVTLKGESSLFGVLRQGDSIKDAIKTHDWNDRLDLNIDHSDWDLDLWGSYKPLKLSAALLYDDIDAKVSWDDGVYAHLKRNADYFIIDTAAPATSSLVFNTALARYGGMKVNLCGARATWCGPTIGLHSARGKKIVEMISSSGENIVSKMQRRYSQLEEGMEGSDIGSLLDTADVIGEDLEGALCARVSVNPRELERHLTFGDRKLDELLHLVALDNKEISFEAEDLADIVDSGTSDEEITDFLEGWLDEPLDDVLERREKSLIYDLANTLAGAEAGLKPAEETKLNSTIYPASLFMPWHSYTVNELNLGNGELFSLYGGRGILDIKTPLFNKNGDTIIRANAVTDGVVLHSINNLVSTDNLNIGAEQLYYLFSFDDDVRFSVEDRDDRGWAELGFSRDSFSVLYENNKQYFLPGFMSGVIARHPENRYFFRLRAAPYLPLEKDDENKPVLKWETHESITDFLGAVSFAYDTLLGANLRFLERDFLMSIHRDVNNENSLMQSFDIASFLNLSGETQVTDNCEIQNFLCSMNFKFNDLEPSLFIERDLERYVYDSGVGVGYPFKQYKLDLSYKQRTWDNDNSLEKVSDTIGFSVSKGDSIAVTSNASYNYITDINTYFAGIRYLADNENPVSLKAGAEYIDYSEPEITVQTSLNFSF